MKAQMSSPEPRRSLVILQPRSLSTPRARITRSCAAMVYLDHRGNNHDASLVWAGEKEGEGVREREAEIQKAAP
ncbi:hypothetical protein EYF80_017885 [Liparis tanakae]|uniref:Uncharacterized protein n=1 Tax=Liparis tanakae TaxID=230148 RepID=A0A4Z2I1S3_9TELE|nr:hypothetical protein EYF80_017885 [Liparis tanakae]